MVAPSNVRTEFDLDYYQRYYESPRTRIYTRARQASLWTAVVGLCEWFGFELRDVLDVGAGVGWCRDWLKKHRPKTRVMSTETNAEVCKKYGHKRVDITTWRVAQQFDLVVCLGVLPYIDDRGVHRAIDNMASMSRGLMYLEAITLEDAHQTIDKTLTDLDVHLRPATFYRDALQRHFRQIGGGLWLRRGVPASMYQLELPPEVDA